MLVEAAPGFLHGSYFSAERAANTVTDPSVAKIYEHPCDCNDFPRRVDLRTHLGSLSLHFGAAESLL